MKTGQDRNQADDLLAVVLADDASFEALFHKWAAAADIDDHQEAEYELLGFLYLRLEQSPIEFADRQRLAGVKRFFWSQHQIHHATWRKTATALTQSGIDVLEPAELAIRRTLKSDHASALPGGPLPVIVHPADFVNAKKLTDSPQLKVADHEWGSLLVTNEVWLAGRLEGGITVVSKDHVHLAAALWRGHGPQSMMYRALTDALGNVAPLDARTSFSLRALANLDDRMRPRLAAVSVTNWPSVAVLRSLRLLMDIEDSGTAVGRKLWRSLPLRVRTPLSPALNTVRRLLRSLTRRP